MFSFGHARGWFAAACISSAACVTGCSSGSADLQGGAPAATGPTSFIVQTGAEAAQSAAQGLAMYPGTLAVDVGDSVTWTFPTHDVHTVALLGAGQATPPPASVPATTAKTYDGSALVNSGILTNGETFTLKFTKAGTYTVYCLIHQPEMQSRIVVRAAGTAYPSSQAGVTTLARQQIQADLNAALASVQLFPFVPGGSRLAMGIAPGLATGKPAHSTVLRFLDGATLASTNVRVAAGTAVTWTDESSNEPHHIVVPPAGATPPPTIAAGGGPSGPTTYDGTTLADSGIRFAGQSYTLNFSRPGVYTYYCILHAAQGMVGTVTVR